MDSSSRAPGLRFHRLSFRQHSHRSSEDRSAYDGDLARPRRAVFERDSLRHRNMKCETRAALRPRCVGHTTVLPLHDALDEMEAQTVSRNIRSDAGTAVERFK